MTTKRRIQTKSLRFRGTHPEVNNRLRRSRKNLQRIAKSFKALGNAVNRAGREFRKLSAALKVEVSA